MEVSLDLLVQKGDVSFHKSLKLDGCAFKLVFAPNLELQYASGKKVVSLERDVDEERPECLVMRGEDKDNMFKVVLPGTSGLTQQAVQLGIIHIGSLYAGVKGDSLGLVTQLFVTK